MNLKFLESAAIETFLNLGPNATWPQVKHKLVAGCFGEQYVEAEKDHLLKLCLNYQADRVKHNWSVPHTTPPPSPPHDKLHTSGLSLDPSAKSNMRPAAPPTNGIELVDSVSNI